MDLGFVNALNGVATGINRADEINRQRYLQDQELEIRKAADARAQEAHGVSMENAKRAWDIQDADMWANGHNLYEDLVNGKMDKPFDFAVKHPAEVAAAQPAVGPAGPAAPALGQQGATGATPPQGTLPVVADAPAGRGGRAGAGSPSGKDTGNIIRTGKSNTLFGSQSILDEANSARESFNKELSRYESLYEAAETPAARRALNARFEKKLADLANTARTKKVEADATRVMEMSAEAVNELLAGNAKAANPIIETLWGPEMVKMFDGAKVQKGRNRITLASGTVLDPASTMALLDKTATLADKQKALQHLGDQLAQDYRSSQQVWAASQRQLDPVEKAFTEDKARVLKYGVTPQEAQSLRNAGITVQPNTPMSPQMADKIASQWMSYNRHYGGKGTAGFGRPELEAAKIDSKEKIETGRRAVDTLKELDKMASNPMSMGQANSPENQRLRQAAATALMEAISDPSSPQDLRLEAALLGINPAKPGIAGSQPAGARLNMGNGGRPAVLAPGAGLPK